MSAAATGGERAAPPASAAARASLERMERFGIRPNRELGQNFLIDANILDVIGRTAGLGSDDVVLEVGGGLGVLSEYLAPRVTHVHVIETDRRLEPLLGEALAPHPNTSIVIDDAMAVDLRALAPQPTKVVANLPYGVAVPVILKSIDELEQAGLWCVMVQREIAARLAAGPGTKEYGIPSVLVQLACSVERARSISRAVFQPQPNVDSALVVLRRKAAGAPAEVRTLVHASFAHRRKALARSLELALPAGGRELRTEARGALEELGHPADERAERLTPSEFVALAERLRDRL